MSEKIGIIIVDGTCPVLHFANGIDSNPEYKSVFENPITITCSYVEVPEIKGIIANRVPKNKGERKRNKADRWK